MTLSEVFQDYLQYLLVEKGCTKTTVQSYSTWANHFQRYLQQNGVEKPTIDDFNPLSLKRYLYHLAGRKLRPRTIRSAFHPLKGLGVYLKELGAIPVNPTATIQLPKLDAARREQVSDDEVRALLSACERQHKPVKVARDRAILSILCYGGLRRMECLDLKLSDVLLEKQCLVVRQGKGQKGRTVYPHANCMDALREWLALRPKADHDYLFPFDKKRRICTEGLARLVEEVKAIAGLADRDNIKPHSLRHNCATRLLRNGADMRTIQSFLGHSHLSTTAIYLHTDENQLREIASLGGLEVKPREGQRTLDGGEQSRTQRIAERRLRHRASPRR